MIYFGQESNISHAVFFSVLHFLRPWCCSVLSLMRFILITWMNEGGIHQVPPLLKDFFPFVFKRWSVGRYSDMDA